MLESIKFIWNIFISFFEFLFSFQIEITKDLYVSAGMLLVGTIAIFFAIGKVMQIFNVGRDN